MLQCFTVKQKTANEMRISDWSSDVCTSELIDDRREETAADAAERRDRKASAFHFISIQFAVASFPGKLRGFLRELHDAFLIGIAHDRHDQTVRCVGGEADVQVFFQDQVFAIRCERTRKLGVLLDRGGDSLDHEWQQGQFDAAFFALRLAERFKLRSEEHTSELQSL